MQALTRVALCLCLFLPLAGCTSFSLSRQSGAEVREADVLPPDFAGYTLTGRVHRFDFKKNWVPTFFPFHVGLSFFTLGGYTIFGGPTTGTSVRITADFVLADAAVNIYTSDAKNPYDSPNLALALFIDATATRLEAALTR